MNQELAQLCIKHFLETNNTQYKENQLSSVLGHLEPTLWAYNTYLHKEQTLQKYPPTCMISRTALQASSLFFATITPFPAARPLAFTTKAGKFALWR